MLGDLSGVSKIFVITGRTDRRKTSDNTIRDLRQTMEVVDNASDENNENTRRKATVVPIKIEYV